MSKITIQLDFAIGDKVKIVAIGDIGIVFEAYIGRHGIEYRVKWFSNGDREDEWLRPEELQAL